MIRNKLRLLFILFILLHGFIGISLAQENPDTDSTLKTDFQWQLRQNATAQDSIASLRSKTSRLAIANHLLAFHIDSLKQQLIAMQYKTALFMRDQDTLDRENFRIKKTLTLLTIESAAMEASIREKTRLLIEKEAQLDQADQRMRDAMNTTTLDKVKLEGRIDVNTMCLEGKDKEINYLQKDIHEKHESLKEKNAEIMRIQHVKAVDAHLLDSLYRSLNSTEKDLLVTKEKLRSTESSYNELVARQSAATNKKKKIRLVQGIAIRNYRTPDWTLAPQDAGNPNVYVISNKNSGAIEFDYITGASIMLKDLSKTGGTMTYDASLFVGFGGNNLFKNFYIGPNVKLFDVLHVNAGMNVAECQLLKTGFREGEALVTGSTIPVVKEWKLNFYFGLSFDFDLITNIPKKIG